MIILGPEYKTKGTQLVEKICDQLDVDREIVADTKAAQLYGEDKVIALLKWLESRIPKVESETTKLERDQLDLRIAELEKAKNRKP